MSHGLGVFQLEDFTEAFDMDLNVRDEFAVEDVKPNKAGDIIDEFGSIPCFDELMLGHGGSVSIVSDIDTKKLDTLREEVALLKTQWEFLWSTHAELAFNVC